MTTLLLEESHAALGGRCEASASPADAGARVVRSYGDATAEARAFFAHAAIVDLSQRGWLRVTGADRVRFIQAMTTNDVASCNPGRGVYGAALNDKGRVVADLTVFVEEDALWLDVEAAARASLPAFFDRYIIMDDVVITEATADRVLLGVHGPAARDVLERALDASVPSDADGAHSPLGNARVWRRDRLGAPGFEVSAPPDAARALFDAIREAGAVVAGTDAFERARIHAGVPRAFVDMDESTLLLEAGLERVVSRTKGCYLGQETIVRALDRGGIRRLLRGVALDDSSYAVPARGTNVRLHDRDVGRVSCATRSLSGEHPIALAILGKDAWEVGTAVDVGGSAARVTALPFRWRSP
jgi:folate-binding protein YgfZ